MSVKATLFAPGLGEGAAGDLVLVDGGAPHVRASRLRAGAPVRLTDGAGQLWLARLESVIDDEVRCVLLEPAPAPADVDLELAFGVASKRRTLWLVEKAVELGVRALQPVEFERSRSVADAARSAAFWQKAERRAAAALAQCGGARLPRLGTPLSLEAYLESTSSTDGVAVALEKEGGRPLLALLDGWNVAGGIRLLVGPGGGMTRLESDACRDAGFRMATLGDRTLRFETAALAAAAAVRLLAESAAIREEARG